MKSKIMDKRRKQTLVFAGSALLLGLLMWGAVYVDSLLPIATGYSAKYLCSATFISNREQNDVEELDLNFFPIKYVSNTVNFKDSSVTSQLLWRKSTAIFRKGVGSTLYREKFRPFKFENRWNRKMEYHCWPLGDRFPDSMVANSNVKLASIANQLVNKGAYGGTCFAFLVLHKGIPVAEAYRTGITPKTRLLGWSMAKSFTNAVVGVLVKDRRVNIFKPIDFSEWKNDDRRNITPNDLLRMQSGLMWNEDYGNRSDVTQMLYCNVSVSRFVKNKPLEFAVGSMWEYSSGSTNLVCDWARSHFESDEAFYDYVYLNLFNKIGMQDAIIEPDGDGLFIGSSYIYATARDYARFALLYMQDGIFNGERILPVGWVQYTRTATRGSNGSYGAGFWLNGTSEVNQLPSDMFSCEGHDGQRIYMIPSKQLVVVILGYSPTSTNRMRFDDLMKDIVSSVK